MTISQSAKNKQEACSLVQNKSINSSTVWMAACYSLNHESRMCSTKQCWNPGKYPLEC